MTKEEFLAEVDLMVAQKDSELLAVDNAKVKLEGEKAKLADMKQAYLDYGDAREQAGRLAGIEEGKAQIQLPDASDPAAQYTQAALNEAVNKAVQNQRDADVLEFQPQIEALGSKVAALEVAVSEKDSTIVAKDAELLALNEKHEAYKAANLAQAQS